MVNPRKDKEYFQLGDRVRYENVRPGGTMYRFTAIVVQKTFGVVNEYFYYVQAPYNKSQVGTYFDNLTLISRKQVKTRWL